MQVLVLGPVTVVDHETSHEVDVARHRAVLAALALRGRAQVPSTELVDAVWGDDPPASADKTLQGYVSALRKRFGEDLIETVPGGYRLGSAVEAVDADEFETQVSSGRQLLAAGDAAGARRRLADALSQWRGEPAADLAAGPVREGHVARLTELRVLAEEARADADLILGHHDDLLPDLERLVTEHPYREPLWRALMLAHYRAGSAGAALKAAQRMRQVLRDDLGISPSPETEALERNILGQDRSLDLAQRPPGNLPSPLDTFVGRDVVQRRIAEHLRRRRLVTLVGIGGVGKSRLATEVAATTTREHPGGTWWVDLASIPPSSSILGHVLAAMDLPVQTLSSPEEVLLARLRRQPTLLVLDNCEHERDQVASFVTRLTAREPDVRILATSRIPLGVTGEQLVQVEPLPIDGESSDGVRLFLDRVRARGESGPIDPSDVASIVDSVGGLPLGLELAAAQCGVRATVEISRSLRDRHELLEMSVDGDDRHRSLGHVFATSIDLLAQEPATALPRLAVLPGDFDLEAAAATLGVGLGRASSMMRSFLDASLVIATTEQTSPRRFRVLWPIRELLLDRLGPAVDESTARCAEHFRRIASAYLDVADGPAETRWLEQARLDDHNLRLALDWWDGHDAVAALDFGPGLGHAWQVRGDQLEGRDTLRRLLERAREAPSLLIAATELELSFLELLSGDAEAALSVGNDAIARLELLDEPRWLSRALRSMAHAMHLGGFDAAVTDPIYQRSLDVARSAELPYSQAITEVHFAHASGAFEQFDRVVRMLDHAEPILRRHGDHGVLAHASLGRAFVAFGRRDAEECRRAGEEMLRHARFADDTIWIQIASVVIGLSSYELGDDARRRSSFRDAVRLADDTANTAQLGIALHAIAATVAEQHPADAARLWGAAGALTPIWPLHAGRYAEWMESARRALGPRFDRDVAAGAGLSVDEAVALADSLL